MKRTRIAAGTLALGLLVLSPVLTGCFQGQKATTTMMATMNSGNGVQASVGQIKLDGLTLVLGPEGSTTATLIGRLTNAGPEDSLVAASIDGLTSVSSPAVQISDGLAVIKTDSAVNLGYDSDQYVSVQNFTGTASTYVPVELAFKNAGVVKASVMVVPATGIYAGITPQFPQLDAPASGSAAPVASDSASAVASASPAAS